MNNLVRYLKMLLVSTCLLILISSLTARGQAGPNSVFKAGGFFYLLEGRYNGFSLHLEYELKFRRSNILTSGPRLDYINLETSYGSTTAGYQFKIYPFFKLFKSRRLEGVFASIYPLYRIKNPDRTYAKHGPGAGILLGFQKTIKGRFSISMEVCSIAIKDLNKKSYQTDPDDIYMYAFGCIKGGVKIK